MIDDRAQEALPPPPPSQDQWSSGGKKDGEDKLSPKHHSQLSSSRSHPYKRLQNVHQRGFGFAKLYCKFYGKQHERHCKAESRGYLNCENEGHIGANCWTKNNIEGGKILGLTRYNRASRINSSKVKCSLCREAKDATMVPGTLPILDTYVFTLFDSDAMHFLLFVTCVKLAQLLLEPLSIVVSVSIPAEYHCLEKIELSHDEC